MALRLPDGKCSIASVADPAPIEGLEILRPVENGDVEDVIWERATLSRIIPSDEFGSLAYPIKSRDLDAAASEHALYCRRQIAARS
jgi:hypothetical protein